MTDIPAHIVAAREHLGAKAPLVESLAEAIAPFIAELQQKTAALEKANAEQTKRNDALEKRVDAVEEKQKEWRHVGPWQQDTKYKVGNHITQNGHTWHCERDNYGCKPGKSDNWRLVVRAGRDAR